MGTSQTAAKNRYNEKTYDRFYVRAAKGTKQLWQEIAAKENKSLNEFIVQSVEKEISRQN